MNMKAGLIFLVMLFVLLAGCRRGNESAPRLQVLETGSEERLTEANVGQDILLTEDTLRFTPLDYNERFVFATDNVRDIAAGLSRWDMTLYAIRNGDIASASKLFSWRNVGSPDIQFTDGFRRCFFLSRRYLNTRIFDLYLADGTTGEIRRLIADTVSSVWRVSKDGKYIGFLNFRYPDTSALKNYVSIYIFDVENEVVIGEFEWQPIVPGRIQGWNIFRLDNIFRIVGSIMRGTIEAVVELDLATMELRTIFDQTEYGWRGAYAPNLDDDEWGDDVRRQSRDPTIRLR